MTDQTTCPSKEALVTWLYDEADETSRTALEQHLRQCAACREEADALTGVRVGLASWTAPDIPHHVRVVPDAPAASVWALLRRPSFALAAAATLVLGVAAGLANLEVRYGSDGLTVRTGWARSPAPAPAGLAGEAGGLEVRPAASATPPAAGAVEPDWREELAALERRIRADMTSRDARAPSPALASTSAAPARDVDPELLRRIQALIDESEVRQQRNLALRVTELSRDFDLQRKADLVQFQQGLGQLEGRTTVETARTRELVNYIIRVSQQPQR